MVPIAGSDYLSDGHLVYIPTMYRHSVRHGGVGGRKEEGQGKRHDTGEKFGKKEGERKRHRVVTDSDYEEHL